MHKITRTILLLVMLSFTSAIFAQHKLEFNIVSFDIDELSLAAQDSRYKMVDGNGDLYAIIKFKDIDQDDDLDGFTFNFGSLNSIVKDHGDELWIYVQRNAKTVTIKRPGYRTIEKYDLNTTIQSGKTYEMVITMSKVGKYIKRDVTKQILQFVVTPSNESAVVKVKKANSKDEYELWGAVDETGSIDKILDFGSYDYLITAPNYVPSSGRVTLTDSKRNFIEKIILKPNFGFLEVDNTYGVEGAQIFVDDIMIGTIPYKNPEKRWECGTYNITITNGDMYKTFKSSFDIKQGETTILKPRLESDYAETTIKIEDNLDAEILIDGKSKGLMSWTGPLKAGNYIVSCKKDKYRETSMNIMVQADKSETFYIPAPIPITGSIYLRSNPSGASIEIDGEMKGTTPTLIQDVLIGNHQVMFSLPNHKTEIYDVTVNEGSTINVEGILSDIAKISINSQPSGAKLFIDEKYIGLTPFEKEMSSGDYNIELRHNKYKIFKKSVHIDSSHPNQTISMERQYQQPYSIYLQPYLQIGQNMAVGGSLGGFIANVNVEVFYTVGMKESEMVYWNSTTNDKPCGYTYKASSMGGRIGYGFILGTKMRITPQIGVGVVNINSASKYNETSSFDASKMYAVNAMVGAKFEYAFCNGIGIFAAPECAFAVTKSKYFESVESACSTIKNFATGVNLRAGVCLFF